MTEIRGQKSEISKATALGTMVFALCSMLLAPCSSAQAQQTGKIFRIGFLDSAMLLVWQGFWGRSSRSRTSLDGLRKEYYHRAPIRGGKA